MASNCLRNSMHLVILNRMCAKRYLWKRRVNKGGEKDIATPSRTKALLDQFGFNFKKV